ncbi:MAG TPA: hypothetical protein VNQ79_26290 [Blastocatellia bacterium]|nr:hypothetical protein [Blastocatellia bacterium]
MLACLLPGPAEIAGSGFFLSVPAGHQDCELLDSCLHSGETLLVALFGFKKLSAQLFLSLMPLPSLPHTCANGSPDDAPQFFQIVIGLALLIPQFINALFEPFEGDVVFSGEIAEQISDGGESCVEFLVSHFASSPVRAK